MHVQVRDPAVLLQVAVPMLQPPPFVAHSLTSVQVTPLPVYPVGHALQVRDPAVFVQVVPAKQPPLTVAHSLTSVQVMPLPV